MALHSYQVFYRYISMHYGSYFHVRLTFCSSLQPCKLFFDNCRCSPSNRNANELNIRDKESR